MIIFFFRGPAEFQRMIIVWVLGPTDFLLVWSPF
jgi:hypothetical protein